MGLSVAFWSLGLGLLSSSNTIEDATFYLKYIHYFGAICIPVFFLHFTLALLDLDKEKRGILYFSYTTTFFLQVLNVTGLLAYADDIPPFNYYTKPGDYYILFTLFFFFIVIYTNYLLYKHYLLSSKEKRNQIGYLFISMVIGFVGGSTAFFPVYDIPIFPFGMFFMFLYIPIMALAIIKHKLMNIDVFLRKSILILFLFTFLFIPIFLLCASLRTWSFNPWTQATLLSFSIIALGLFIPKLRVRGELKIENILYGRKIDHQRALTELQHAFVSKLELSSLYKTIVETLSTALDVREFSIFFMNTDDANYKMAYFLGNENKKFSKLLINKDSPVVEYFKEKPICSHIKDFYKYLNENNCFTEYGYFNSINTHLILPINSHSGLIAFLVIGKMHSEINFTKEDENIFKNLGNEIAIAIDNAISFQKIKELNATLDEKVEERTKELERALKELKSAQEQMIRAGKLASIGTLAAGIAHEVNNALNATVNSANNLNKFWNQLTHDQKLPENLHSKMENAIVIIHKGMERTRNIVDNLMRFSRKNEEGFKLDNIHEGINSTLEMLSNEFRVRNITLTKDLCETDQVYCNLSELNQVFFNIFVNALDAIDKNGTLQIKTYTQDNNFFIAIKDNGTGIDPKHLGQIFDPFFTTKPVGKGTGLGLATSYNIVKDHGGQIDVKSTLKQGTEFIISIPLSKQLAQREAP